MFFGVQVATVQSFVGFVSCRETPTRNFVSFHPKMGYPDTLNPVRGAVSRGIFKALPMRKMGTSLEHQIETFGEGRESQPFPIQVFFLKDEPSHFDVEYVLSSKV